MAADSELIAMAYESGAAEFIERLNFAPGTRALDVACGTGNLAIPAARAGALVTGVDLSARLLEEARLRALCEGLMIQFDVGDAERLPYDDASSDAVVSMFGVMFAPRPDMAAAELTRVCRPGGRIALANWTPDGFIGQLLKIIDSYAPTAPLIEPLLPSPVLWGDERTVRERLREKISDVRCARRRISLKIPFAPADVVEFWRDHHGATRVAFERLNADQGRQMALRRDLELLWTAHNKATGHTTRVESEYLEVIATRS